MLGRDTNEQPADPAPVYCPACWGAGRLYRPPASADGHPTASCGCAKPSIEDFEAYPCPRCAGTGTLPAARSTIDGGA